MLLGSDASNISSVNRLSIKKFKTYFQGQKSTFFGGKVFFAISQMTPSGRRRRRRRRHRRRTALRRFDLGTNANRFTTKLKPV